MKYLIAAVVLSLLILKLVSLLPAEAAGRNMLVKAVAWQGATVSGVAAAPDAAPAQLPSGLPSAAQAQVVVSAQILPVRLLVVDDKGNLAEVWSNGGEAARLEARVSSRNGPEVLLTDALRAAYDRVVPTIPPGARGLVYQRP